MLVLLTSLDITSAFAGLRGNVNTGNRYYNRQDYDKALEKYRDGLIDDPESKELHFNLGNGLYKQENYEEAVKEYDKATYSKDILLQSKAYYNMGNCLFRMNKLPESIQYYKKALELNPKDKDAKYNIEFVQRKIKENLNKQPQNQQQQQQQNQQQQKQDQQKQQQDQKDKNKEQQKQQEKKGQQKEGMSKEDAERLIKAFEEDDKNAQKRKKIPAAESRQADQDW